VEVEHLIDAASAKNADEHDALRVEPAGDEPQPGPDLVRLMVDYQAGRLDGFERLYAALAPAVARYLASAMPDAASAEDLLQETFLEIHRGRRTYLPPLPVRPWVFGVAKNVLRRHRRSAWRRANREANAPAGGDGQATAPPAAALPRDMAEAVERLPPGRREAWVLHHLHGLSFRQIAARLRIGVGAAKLRSSRATRALRSELGADPGERDE
jgi:RNA polymerase sigma factor (sigma-70 family)